jgi:hypothetical protein
MSTNYEQENQTALHFLLTPVRFVMSLLKWSALLFALIFLFLFNQAGWLVGLGSRGLMERQQMADRIEAILPHRLSDNTGADYGVWTLDFAHRDDPFNYAQAHDYGFSDYRPHSYGVSDGNGFHSQGFRPAAAFTGKMVEGWSGSSIPFCNRESSDEFDTRMAWSDPVSALRRKSARMRNAYVTAAIMTSALRYTLVRLQRGEGIENRGPERVGELNSFCNADQGDVHAMSATDYAMWSEATSRIRLPDAPQVMLREVDLRSVGSLSRTERGTEITGMCLINQCDQGDLGYHVTKFADLFATAPPLSAGQERAEQALLHTATPDYWYQAAEANGVHDREAVARGLRYAEYAVWFVEGSTIMDRIK